MAILMKEYNKTLLKILLNKKLCLATIQSLNLAFFTGYIRFEISWGSKNGFKLSVSFQNWYLDEVPPKL